MKIKIAGQPDEQPPVISSLEGEQNFMMSCFFFSKDQFAKSSEAEEVKEEENFVLAQCEPFETEKKSIGQIIDRDSLSGSNYAPFQGDTKDLLLEESRELKAMPELEKEESEDEKQANENEIEVESEDEKIVSAPDQTKPKCYNYAERIKNWLSYSKYGKPIKDLYIIPSKTFVESKRWRQFFKPSDPDYYSLIDCIREHRARGINITKIVDLNNSKIYYDFDVISKRYRKELKNVEYRKIMIDPMNMPRKKDLNKVVDILAKNLYQKGENKTYVLIHCTQGVNRVGYVLMYFLHVRLGIPLDEARQIFEEARGHKIYSDSLIKDLYERCKFDK